MQLSDQDKQLISTAIDTAEQETGFEIVPVITSESDTYESALWRSAFIFCLVSLLLLSAITLCTNLLLFANTGLWLGSIALITVIGTIVTYNSPWLKRFFCDNSALAARAEEKALATFTQLGVYETNQANGLLIFISEFEHQVVIYPDRFLREHVTGADWQPIISQLCRQLKNKQSTAGLIEAIQSCSLLFQELEITIPPTENEISNEVHEL